MKSPVEFGVTKLFGPSESMFNENLDFKLIQLFFSEKHPQSAVEVSLCSNLMYKLPLPHRMVGCRWALSSWRVRVINGFKNQILQNFVNFVAPKCNSHRFIIENQNHLKIILSHVIRSGEKCWIGWRCYKDTNRACSLSFPRQDFLINIIIESVHKFPRTS